MKNNVLRAPLIKSAVLLVAFSLIIYLTVSSPEGSVWSSLGIIFYTFFKAAQLAVGLFLALFVCFAVLMGIFFGCVAMVSRESSAKMYEQLRRFMSEQFNAVKSLLVTGNKWKTRSFSGSSSSIINDLSRSLKKSLEDMRQAQVAIEEKLRVLQSRVDQSEQDESITTLSDWLRAEEKKTEEVRSSLELLDRKVEQLQKQAGDSAEQPARISALDSLKEVTCRIEVLEKNSSDFLSGLQSVKEQMALLGRDVAALKEVFPEVARKEKSGPGQGDVDQHRLFSYLENPREKERIQQLVAEALDREMTYAQAADYIAENVSPETSRIITEHPSLTKEFIRENRKKT